MFDKKLCGIEERMSEQQFLTDVFLLLKQEYVAKINCNGEYISVKLLNGQTFTITVKEIY